MEELKQQQVEALKSADEYLPRLIEAAEAVAKELKGEQEEDTKDLFNQVIDGVNWILEIFNGTMSLLNKERIMINPDELEEKIQNLSKAILSKESAVIAEELETGMIPFLQNYQVIIKEFI